MDVQDYEYFEERANDVILQDITSSQHNANILRRLRHNDPEFTTLSINVMTMIGTSLLMKAIIWVGWGILLVGAHC